MKPKSSQVFYRSALATAVIMALSGPAMAGGDSFTSGKLSADATSKVTISDGSQGGACTEESSTCKSYDLNGHKIAVTTAGGALGVEDTTNDTVLTNTGEAGGTISASAASGAVSAVDVKTDKNVTLNNVTVSATATTANASTTATAVNLASDKNTNVTMNNVTLEATSDNGKGKIYSIYKKDTSNSTAATDTVNLNDSTINSGNIWSENGSNTDGHTLTVNASGSTIGKDSDNKIKIVTKGTDSTKADTLNLNATDSNIFADINVSQYATANMTLGSGAALVGGVSVADNANGFTATLKDGAIWEGDLTNNEKTSRSTSTVSLDNDAHWTGNLTNKGNASVSLTSGSRWDGNVSSLADSDKSASVSVSVDGAIWSGNVNSYKASNNSGESTASVTLTNGAVWNGGVNGGSDSTKTPVTTTVSVDNSQWSGTYNEGAGSSSTGWLSALSEPSFTTTTGDTTTEKTPVVVLKNNARWVVTGTSFVDGVLKSENSDIVFDKAYVLNVNALDATNTTLHVDDTSWTGTLNLGVAKGNINVQRAGTVKNSVSGRYINLKDKANSNLTVSGTTESGLYQYDMKEFTGEDTGYGSTYWSFAQTDRTSNAGAVIQAMAAAPANVANLQADTLSARQDAARLNANDDGGVWVQYFGGKQKHTTAGNAAYNLDVNGVMVGGDTRVRTDDGSWLAGVAMSSAKGDMTTMQSKGDTEGYSFHAYLSRQYNNGFFVDTAAQFGHYSNTADVRIANGGGSAKADFNTNGFGAMVKGGYTWKDGNGLFVQPYAKLSALTLEGVDYQLNGVDVHSDSYNSVLGEAGTRVGYDFAVGNATVKPYLNLAALNEFSDGNKVRLGDESVNASIDGAAFRVGAGVQADITKNVGAFASLGYTKGNDVENPLQGLVGVNVTW
ncbi:autotransporter outer membrane beta-barrel domain-containing protein [Escherichia coli]